MAFRYDFVKSAKLLYLFHELKTGDYLFDESLTHYRAAFGITRGRILFMV
jgi:hypothetical protein